MQVINILANQSVSFRYSLEKLKLWYIWLYGIYKCAWIIHEQWRHEKWPINTVRWSAANVRHCCVLLVCILHWKHIQLQPISSQLSVFSNLVPRNHDNKCNTICDWLPSSMRGKHSDWPSFFWIYTHIVCEIHHDLQDDLVKPPQEGMVNEDGTQLCT